MVRGSVVSFGGDDVVLRRVREYVDSRASGVCYTQALRKEFVLEGFLQLFSWPTFEQLMVVSCSWFKTEDELRQLRVVRGKGDLCHLVSFGDDSFETDGVPLLNFVSLARAEDYPSGSLGRIFGGAGGDISVEAFRSFRLGGEVVVEKFPYDLYDDRLRPYLTSEVVVKFFSAYAQHYSRGSCESSVGKSVCDLLLSGEFEKDGKLQGLTGSEADVKCDDVERSSVGCQLLGPRGGLSVGRGPNYLRNRQSRERRKLAQSKGGSTLQSSLEAKWEMENKLAVKQAERKIALLGARDLEAEKKMQRAQIMRTTELAKVQTERAYATLKRTGNVPGFAETVVTDGSCPALSPSRSDGTCISPDSSVSQQEIRAMMKELEDCKLTLKRIERDNPALVAHHMEGHGVKTAFTLDSDGLCPVDEPGSMGADGKYHLDSYEPNPRFYKDRFRAEEFAEKYFGS